MPASHSVCTDKHPSNCLVRISNNNLNLRTIIAKPKIATCEIVYDVTVETMRLFFPLTITEVFVVLECFTLSYKTMANVFILPFYIHKNKIFCISILKLTCNIFKYKKLLTILSKYTSYLSSFRVKYTNTLLR